MLYIFMHIYVCMYTHIYIYNIEYILIFWLFFLNWSYNPFVNILAPKKDRMQFLLWICAN